MAGVAALVALALAAAAPAAAQGGLTAEGLTEGLESQLGLGASRSLGEGRSLGVAPADGAQDDTPGEYRRLPEGQELSTAIAFDFDSAVIRADQEPVLAVICEGIRAAEVPRVRIVGHTDASGPEAYNETLSRLRAEEVRRHLVERCEVAPERLEAIGVGEGFPLRGADPAADENRRVEFQALG